MKIIHFSFSTWTSNDLFEVQIHKEKSFHLQEMISCTLIRSHFISFLPFFFRCSDHWTLEKYHVQLISSSIECSVKNYFKVNLVKKNVRLLVLQILFEEVAYLYQLFIQNKIKSEHLVMENLPTVLSKWHFHYWWLQKKI